MEPFLSEKRKVVVTIQDFCNILEGGFVSLHTLSPATVQKLLCQSPGAVVCVYDWKLEDVLPQVDANVDVKHLSQEESKRHRFLLVCWRSGVRALNAMCGKTGLSISMLISNKRLFYTITYVMFFR